MPRLLLRTALLTSLLAGSALLPAAPALAHPAVPPGAPLGPDRTFTATDNVEHLGRFPQHTGTAGGALSADGTRFYLTDPRGVYAYDTTTPASPTLLDSLPLFQTATGVALAQEDPATDGRILLVDGAATPAGPAALHVVDVSDPTDLKVLSRLPGVTDHTWTCVSGPGARGRAGSCDYAYGRTGHIVDLRNPGAPRLLEQTWRKAVGYDRGSRGTTPYAHDLTEIRPGLVMSAGSAAILMDTADPAAPEQLTRIEQEGRFSSLGYHSVEWGRGGRSPWLVMGTEIAPSGPTSTAGSDCEGGGEGAGKNSVIETWDARAVVEALETYQPGTGEAGFGTATFTKVDAFDAGSRGLFTDGAAPGHVLFCAHWMELHPDFAKSGLMAVSYYDRGTRFVQVGKDGHMREVGWIVAAEGYSGSPQWISDEVVYVMDYRRGLEVVRLLDRPAKKATTRMTEIPRGQVEFA